MGPFSFVIRTAIITIVLVMLLQIRWGNDTIEDLMMTAITSSAVVTPLNKTAEGSVKFVRNMWNKVNRSFDTHFSRALQEENRPGSRHLGFSIERSEKAIKQKAEDVEEVAKGAYEEAKESSTFQKFKASADRAKAKIQAKLREQNKEDASDEANRKSAQ